MGWDNCFSYGDNNKIRFDEVPLTQLVGPNGAGKTSISLMIQEVLYGKNIKNIKKQDITNNKSGKSGYNIFLEFEKGKDIYTITLDRKSNLKLKLYKNSKDRSSHTSLNTYKTIANIIGVEDFKIFCQLIYQHSTDSLDFLTATDTNRKKFLISLLQLDKYIELHDLFKDKVRTVTSDITQLTGSINTIESWINNNKDMDFVKQNLIPLPETPISTIERVSELQRNIANINSINRKIILNKQYKDELDSLDPDYYMGIAPLPPYQGSQELLAQIRVLEHERNLHQEKIKKLNKVKDECPTCLQVVDKGKWRTMFNEETKLVNNLNYDIQNIQTNLVQVRNIEIDINKHKKEKENFERLHQLIDSSLQNKTLDLHKMQNELNSLSTQISSFENDKKSIEAKNLKISAHNSKVDVIKSQLKKMKEDLLDKDIKLVEKENLASILELLKKTFSTNGLVSYKIESSVKELERKINEYLAEMTYFQIYFKLSGEKLNIEVLDDIGNITSISNLSSGERARVNIATILAIRNILSSLTSTKINLLFLDEVIGVIDAEGKEKLSEILLKENLNTFIVSHDWTHPLIPRINIIKEHHISRIEND
jgi:DNA repair exonuclease SbcCD ATPase subunit